jgi:pimeloyl-[acyl-carrier protein] methyl ester esterase
MQAIWTRKTGSSRVILFMNGWGMDAAILTHAPTPEGWDMLMICDYSDLRVPSEATACLDSESTVVLAAWSMGVWAAGTLTPFAGRIAGSVAVNGTAAPVDDLYGIPPAIYRATVASFSETNRMSFYRRMCGGAGALQRFLTAAPQRGIADQHAELAAIERLAPNSTLTPFPFRKAVVGSRDMIIPSVNQQRFWNRRGDCRVADVPHFPFFHLSLNQLIADATCH